MCMDPATLAIAAGAAQLGQTYVQTKSQASYYDAQAQADTQNANTVSKQAELQADKYAQEQRAMSNKAKLARGQAAAAYGASGLEMSGSGLDVMSSIENAYQQDSLTSLANQRSDNYALRVQQTNYKNSASANRSAAHNTNVSGVLSGIGTILGTAASVNGIKSDLSPGTTGATGATGATGTLTNPYRLRRNSSGSLLGYGRG